MLLSFLLLNPAEACDPGVMSTIPLTDPPPGQDVHVLTGKATVTPPAAGGAAVTMAGARVVFNSTHPVSWWRKVLTIPENQEEWHPADMGTLRVERLDPKHIFQQSHIRALGGAVNIRRQSVIEINWLSLSDQKLQNCWVAADPAPYMPVISKWVNDATWLRIGYGGWQADPTPTGGARISYQFWVEAELLPAGMVAWAMSRTLPDMVRIFDARVEAVNGGASVNPG